ncbi:leucine-rich repeat domain-containing protein [Vibrio sp. S9_S30]|uniref:leucine-rich repeat domain-containing protein n=1 Tax=Vibrio sp. S9_S30 TaxID=2720226 RepID=UPI001680D923|nr:hypothetical protein [Vibrio sp. S9_S30]MBD1558545.1 leucine-rich repeat domain-containing protein [Vibrio sp. S9_S30]
MLKKLLLITFILFTFPTMGYEDQERQTIANSSEEAKKFIELYKGYKGYAYVFSEGLDVRYLPQSEGLIDDKGSVRRRFQQTSIRESQYKYFFRHNKYRNYAVVNSKGKITQLVLEVESRKSINHSRLIDFISNLNSLEYLSIRSGWESFKEVDLENNSKLKQVYFDKIKVEKIILPQNGLLEVIDFYTKKNVIFENLKYQRNLKAMNLIGGNIDLSEISVLDKMENLYISHTKHIKGVNNDDFVLSKLKNLERLYIPNSENIEIIGLEKLNKLKKLSLGQVVDYSGVVIPPSVEYLSSGGKLNTKLPDLSRSKNLKTFISKKTSITDLNGLSDLPYLEEVIIENSKLQSLNGLNNLPSLKTLTIHYGELKTIGDIHSLNALEEIELEYQQFENLDGLKNLPSLKSLIINGGTIKSLDKLEGIDNLEKLGIMNQEIRKVENIDHFKNLKYVSYRGNPIEELDFKNIESLAYCKVDISETKFYESMSDIDKTKLKNLHRKGNINGKQGI